MKLLQQLLEVYAKEQIFHVKVGNDDWEEITFGKGVTLDEIEKAISDHSFSNHKFNISALSKLVKKYIGDGPNGYGPAAGHWNEMDFEVISLKDDVLKIKYMFFGVDRHHKDCKKSGIITIIVAA
jgi:hypothetical protein